MRLYRSRRRRGRPTASKISVGLENRGLRVEGVRARKRACAGEHREEQQPVGKFHGAVFARGLSYAARQTETELLENGYRTDCPYP